MTPAAALGLGCGVSNGLTDQHPGGLSVERVGAATLDDWQRIHNVIIPSAPLTVAEVRERSAMYLLEVAYVKGVAAGATTVRPPTDSAAATVIVRILPEFRRRGYGTQLYTRAVGEARRSGWEALETVVWESNVDGLTFARNRGYVEIDRYYPEGARAAFITMRQQQP